MEFGKVKGFWTKAASENNDVIHSSSMTKYNANNNNNDDTARLQGLDEIKPEITAEGYGLRTPYGTHLDLDFVKYCEDLASGQHSKRTLTKPATRHRIKSPTNSGKPHCGQHRRLSSEQSNDSLDNSFTEDMMNMGLDDPNSDHTLMETRRRLEAFRSFRSRRHKSSAETIFNPPHPIHPSRIGYGTGGDTRGSNIHHRNGQTTASNGNYGNVSPCSSSSGRTTPSGPGTIHSGSQVTPQHLQIVREQMASALVRLKELEEQVKTIPTLQVKISVLQQEKKHLLDELKLREDKISAIGSENTTNLILTKRSNVSSPTSGASSLSFHQSSLYQSQSKPLLKKSLSSDSYKESVELPPCPPRRKYRSLAVGDEVPLDDIVCYQKGYNSSCQTIYKPPPRKESIDFGCIVNQMDIDAAFNIFSPPPPQFVDAATSTNQPKLISTSFQTNHIKTKNSTMQTHQPSYATKGIGTSTPQMRDNYCNPITSNVRHMSTMTIPMQKQTNETATSSHDLIKFAHKRVGPEVRTTTTSTGTDAIVYQTQQTTCDGLVSYQDAKCGPEKRNSVKDAATATDRTCTNDVATLCQMPLKNPKVLVDRNTMTLQLHGRWMSYANMVSVSCGGDSDISLNTTSTNTESISVKNKCTSTIRTTHSDKTNQTAISPQSNNVSTNTSSVLKYNRSTDCSEIQPVLRHNASNTTAVKTNTASTQYATNRSNLVDCMVNTDIVKRSNAETSTDDLGLPNNIDVYVDKVQSLLEEQQSLLAEKYEVFAEEWDKKEEKVSRFVNPFFTEEDGPKPEEDDSSKPNPIEASLFFIESPLHRESSSSEESDTDSSDSENERPTLRPLPSPDNDIELKSIMKKPGTPSGTKKFLRFAEGVKSDDDSSSCSSSDESWDEEEEEETDGAKKENESSEEKKDEEKDISSSESEEEVEVIEEPSPVEKNEFNYSNEFVRKKSEETTSSVPPVEEEKQEQEEQIREETKIEIRVEPPTGEQAQVELSNCEPFHLEEDELLPEQATKYIFTTKVLDACDILEKHLRNPKSIDKPSLAVATTIVQQEWFRVAAQTDSCKNLLDDFVTDLANTSLPVLRKVVNMTDSSGNTVLHYAISHGNISVIDSLLSIDELDVNRTNQAGYTSAMLAALCEVTTDFERRVFKKLFSKSNINAHAKEAGQTSLMLAVSHGRTETAQLLLNCGAEINARDQDGSTALMCAVEHNQLEAVKLLFSMPNCDPSIADADGSTALNIAMDAGRNDIAILLYAQANFRSNSRSPKPRTACKSMIPSPIQKPIKS